MDEWTNGRLDEWTIGRMDEWTSEQMERQRRTNNGVSRFNPESLSTKQCRKKQNQRRKNLKERSCWENKRHTTTTSREKKKEKSRDNENTFQRVIK